MALLVQSFIRDRDIKFTVESIHSLNWIPEKINYFRAAKSRFWQQDRPRQACYLKLKVLNSTIAHRGSWPHRWVAGARKQTTTTISLHSLQNGPCHFGGRPSDHLSNPFIDVPYFPDELACWKRRIPLLYPRKFHFGQNLVWNHDAYREPFDHQI